jgi:bifunctional oligoribonuclease and PAP phosphatase NrnA
MHYSEASPAIKQAITASKNILAISHANPDADAVASLIGFKLAFESERRTITTVLGPGTVPETLLFLPAVGEISPIDSVDVSDFDLVVFIDCADEERLGPSGTAVLESARSAQQVINIDHHVTNSRFGTINLVDPEAAASCEILHLLLEDLNIAPTADIATTLMAGIQGDTLGLRTPSTTGRTMEVSAQLLRNGADLDTIVDYLFRIRPYSTLKLWAQALSAATFTGQLIWTEITSDMLEHAGADASEAEGIVNFLAGTQGARAAAMLYRKPDGWRVSLRSLTDDVDVSDLAGLFGGGGHARAAGCSLTGDVTIRDDFLTTIADRIAAPSQLTRFEHDRA